MVKKHYIKEKTVEQCQDCPNFCSYKCRALDKLIPYGVGPWGIPSWCPLRDKWEPPGVR